MYDLAVVGGGPAGLTAGLVAAAAGARVCLFEKEKRIGRRLSVTGNGRGNVGNCDMRPVFYNNSAFPLLKDVDGALDPGALKHVLESLGILTTTDQAGRVYPLSRQANSIVWALHDLLHERDVDVKTNTLVTAFDVAKTRADSFFSLHTSDALYQAKTLVLAVGGRAHPKLGGSDSYMQLLKSRGVSMVEPVPALAAIRTENKLASAKGVRVPAMGRLTNRSGDTLMESKGEYQLTKTGVSGIAAMRLARCINTTSEPTVLQVDFLPDYTEAGLIKWLRHIRTIQPKRDAGYVLDSLLPQKLALAIASQIVKKAVNKDLTDKQIALLAKQVKTTRLQVNGTDSFEQAQVMSGGVHVSEVVADTLESVRDHGLYLCGEMLDVDGDTGGYNLHWAFISGNTAGLAAASTALSRAD